MTAFLPFREHRSEAKKYGTRNKELMQKTAINAANFQDVMESATNAGHKGQAQFVTPLDWAMAICKPLPDNRPVIVDLQAGPGNLLAGASNLTTNSLLAMDIEKCKDVPKADRLQASISRINTDCTKAFELLKLVQFDADLFVLNPPWDMHWHKDRLESLATSETHTIRTAFAATDPRLGKDKIDSTAATMMMALELMTMRGEGVLICNEKTIDRLIFGIDAPYSSLRYHAWVRFAIKGNPMTESKGATSEFEDDGFKTAVVYFAKSHVNGVRRLPECETLEEVEASLNVVKRYAYREGRSIDRESDAADHSASRWKAVRSELQSQSGERESAFNIWMDQRGFMRTALSSFQDYSLTGAEKKAAERLFKLNGQRPMALVVQQNQRKELLAVIQSKLWTVDPRLLDKVEEAVKAYHSVRAPLQELPPIQRLGYLDETDSIMCIKSIPGEFKKGNEYRVRTRTVMVERMTTKPTTSGDEHEFLLRGQELAIYICDDAGSERCFMDRNHKRDGVTVEGEENPEEGWREGEIKIDHVLQDLAANFEIPSVPDVTEVFPEAFAKKVAMMDEFQRIIDRITPVPGGGKEWKFKKFQRKDLPANAMHSGSVMAWDTGLGKSIAAMIYGALQAGNQEGTLSPAEPCLLIAPGGLHDQLIDEFIEFQVPVTKLDCQDTFLKLTKGNKPLPAGWYITSFTQLATNKVSKIMSPSSESFTVPPTTAEIQAAKVENRNAIGAWDMNAIAELMHYYSITMADAREEPEGDHICDKAINLCRRRWVSFSDGIGQAVEYKQLGLVRCVFSPSLGELCRTAFSVVAVDEATRIKGEKSQIGVGCRNLNPKHRLILTATPIKNRLPDIFYLLHWAAGGHPEPHPRFPFSGESHEQTRFEDEFLVSQRDLTKEKTNQKTARRRKKKPKGKKTASVCNIHRLWKLLAPLVSRRRKSQVDEDIVKKIRKPVYCPMGVEQAKVYEYHLNANYRDKNGRIATGAQLQALRSVSSAPHSPLLNDKGTVFDDDDAPLPYVSRHEFVPKTAAALRVIADCMSRREQVAVFSAILEPNDTIGRRLKEAGVPFVSMDGRTSASKRGAMSRDFQRGLDDGGAPVSLNGLGSMAEGNNWFRCRNCILIAYDWAYNLFEQAINRIHRMNSMHDVTVWPIIVTGTVDRVLENLIGEKSDASELVLDGALLGDNSEEVSLQALLDEASVDFNKDGLICERELENSWPSLKKKLNMAWKMCNGDTPDPVMLPSRPLLEEVVMAPTNVVFKKVLQLDLFNLK
jgi:hypothetical protein